MERMGSMGVRRSIKMSCKSCTSYQALQVQWRIEVLVMYTTSEYEIST